MKKLKIDPEQLKYNYLVKNMTISQCAEHFNCGKTTIVRLCKEHNLAKPVELKNKNISKATTKHDHGLIKQLYFKDNLTKQQISDKLNIKIGAVQKVIALSSQNKTKDQKQRLLSKLNIDKETLTDLYINQNKSLSELCEYFKVGHTALRRALRQYNINKPEELRQKLVLKTFIRNGKANIVNGLNTKQLTEKYSLSTTLVNRFIKNHPDSSDLELMKYMSKMKLDRLSSIELKLHNALQLPFYNKKIPNACLKYKPDFKLTNNLYLNVDGLYWHSDRIKEDNRYHFKMRKAYEDNGLRILQFREDELGVRLPIVLSMIGNQLGDNKKIYARKCEIREVSQKEATNFLIKNHIMGNYRSRHIGLYYNDSLVMIVSYKFYNKNKCLKLERMCSALNTSVVGGFSRLLKHIMGNISCANIHYWVDLRYGTGDFLLNHGFKVSHETLGWKWTDFTNTYNRRVCRANMDDRKLTEKEHANELGLVKIYDAGQRLYVKGDIGV